MSDNPPRRGNTLNELLTCAVCLDSLTDPRTLPCLHTFCTDCIIGCLRPLRRDMECPICKRVTVMPAQGVNGLPIDYRVQQIRDIIASQAAADDAAHLRLGAQQAAADAVVDAAGKDHSCDMCKARACRPPLPPATAHCLQCVMWFCVDCLSKHAASVLFSSHDVLRLDDSNSSGVSDTLFCALHREQAVRYLCATCRSMMCTVCVMEHDQTHKSEAFDRSAIDRCRNELKMCLRTVQGLRGEVSNRIKCIEALRQSQQTALYRVQALIHDRTAHLINQLRQQESQLISDAQARFDARLSEFGADRFSELTFFYARLETLYQDLFAATCQSPPHKCLLVFDELAMRTNSVKETVLPPVTGVTRPRGASMVDSVRFVQFIPSPDNMDLVIGRLQDCSVATDDGSEAREGGSGAVGGGMETGGGEGLGGATASGHSMASVPLRKRTASILSALSPSRKDTKIGRVKDSNRVSSNWRRWATGTCGGAEEGDSSQADGASTSLTGGGGGQTTVRRLTLEELLADTGTNSMRTSFETQTRTDLDAETARNPSPSNAAAVVTTTPVATATSFALRSRLGVFSPSNLFPPPTATSPSELNQLLNFLSANSSMSSIGASVSPMTQSASSSPATLTSPSAVSVAVTSSTARSIIAAIAGNTGSSSVPLPQTVPTTSGTVVSVIAGVLPIALRPTLSPYKSVQVFTVDAVGGLPGCLTLPSGVAVFPNGAGVIVAETEQRLQIFDRGGASKSIIGWGHIKPHSVLITPDNHIVCTDKKDRTVKTYTNNCQLSGTWEDCSFGLPSGLAIMSTGQYVVSDTEKKCVTIHSASGRMQTRIGTWGIHEYQFRNPEYVAVEKRTNNIYVSDPDEAIIKVFDRTGTYVREFTLHQDTYGTNSPSPPRPAGLCADVHGNLVICDPDNNRVSLYSSLGHFMAHILTHERDGIRHPRDVDISSDGSWLSVVEAHSGFLNNNPHHVAKMYKLS